MDFALLSGEGAVTMEVSSFKGTSVCAIGVDQCSLAVELAIFPLSDVVVAISDVSAESLTHPIHE